MSFPSPSSHLRFDGVSAAYGSRRVLTDISFAVASGSRVGLIGENGSGKSTLLRIAAGLLQPDAGSVTAVMPGGRSARIGLLQQQPPFAPRETILQAIHTATAPVRSALDHLNSAAEALAVHQHTTTADAYASALSEVEELGAWELDSRIERTLSGLGIAELPRDRETGSLSGGQRARLSLAWLLLNSPDVLLLDEPTNHLDDSACDYLVRMLAAWRGPTMFASHDRAFLDEAATSLVDLDPTQLPAAVSASLVQDGSGSAIGTTRFTGSYSDYLGVRRQARQLWEQRYADEQAELRRLSAAIGANQTVGHVDWKPRSESRMAQKFYGDRNARVVARRVNDARTRLEVLSAGQLAPPPRELSFAGILLPKGTEEREGPDDGLPSGSPADVHAPLAIAVCGAGISGRLAPTTLRVATGDKWLITGANGAGKSTLLRALAGRVRPDVGSIAVAGDLRVGMLDQEITFADPSGRGANGTVREVYLDGVGLELAEAVPLARFGLIAARDEGQPLGSLSVGQQRRLALAILLADPPEILLLDEPTNHLSLTLADELERAVAEFTGTVLVASHDRWLRRRWQSETVELNPPEPPRAPGPSVARDASSAPPDHG